MTVYLQNCLFFQKIILEDASYTVIPVIVSYYDTTGISNTNIDLAKKERNLIISESLPSRVIKDYERYKDKECEMLELIPQFKYTRTINKIITGFTKIVIYLFNNKTADK